VKFLVYLVTLAVNFFTTKFTKEALRDTKSEKSQILVDCVRADFTFDKASFIIEVTLTLPDGLP